MTFLSVSECKATLIDFPKLTANYLQEFFKKESGGLVKTNPSCRSDMRGEHCIDHTLIEKICQ